ncbi:hypothetical protein ES703_101665 [subsurface metagenome]
MISIEHHENVMVVRLDRNVTNALNPELVNDLGEKLKRAKNDRDVHGIVLSGSNEKFFSIGFDIPQLIELDRKDF